MNLSKLFISILVIFLFYLSACDRNSVQKSKSNNKLQNYYFPVLKTNDDAIDTVAHTFNIAIGDIMSNIRPYKNGLVRKEEALLFAGLDYYGPWTRDAAINIWNGAGLFLPDISERTLISDLDSTANGNIEIIGQYWDKIIWTVGAWNLYLYNGDKEFLKLVYKATCYTLSELERNEFDPNLNLFRGPAVYGDGISAYPDRYTQTGKYEGGEWVSTITKWAEANPDKRVKVGSGMPMFALSTNCVYFEVYRILPKIEKELGLKINENWADKSARLKVAINKNFWNNEKKNYRYLVDPYGNCDYQEGMGISYALLFDVANKIQSEEVLKNTVVTKAGIPCVYPSFPRYKNGYGRHSGTVWTHIQGFWANAAAQNKDAKRFAYDFNLLTAHTWRDKQFREIYHPETGLPYGGLQESNEGKLDIWKSTERQTWGATAYLRMIFNGLFGMSFSETGINFSPVIPTQYPNLRLLNLLYRDAVLNISVKGQGTNVVSFTVNGKSTKPFIPANAEGIQNIEIVMN